MYAYDENGTCICARCGCVLTSDNDTRDHFIPKSFYNNGDVDRSQHLTENENIVHTCRQCNNSIGNIAKDPDWYSFLSDDDKDILYETIHKFIFHTGKSDSGVMALNEYINEYSSYMLRKPTNKEDLYDRLYEVENDIKQEPSTQVSYAENKIKNLTKDLSLQTILESMIKMTGIGGSIKVGGYMLNITDNGLELDLAF